MELFDQNGSRVTSIRPILFDSTIESSLRLQKFFHPTTLPNELHGNTWITFKQSEEEVKSFITEVERLQNYTKNSKSKERYYLYCEYSNRNKKKNVKTSNKTNCQHKIRITELKTGEFEIKWDLVHNHAFNPLKPTKSARDWLWKLINNQVDWSTCKLRLKNTDFMNHYDVFSDQYKITNSMFNYFKNKRELKIAYLDDNVVTSMKLWEKELNENNNIASFKKVKINDNGFDTESIDNEYIDENDTWFFGIIIKSQLSYMRDPETVFLDATHKLGYGPNDQDIFVYNFIVKSSLTGKGTPIAFLITNKQSHEPLAAFLKLFVDHNIKIKRFIIDCLPTEVKAIERGYNNYTNDADITYCTWHLLRTFRKNVNSCVKLSVTSSENDHTAQQNPENEVIDTNFLMQLAQNAVSLQSNLTTGSCMDDVITNRKIALVDLMELKRMKTFEDANTKLAEIQEKYHMYPQFVQYVLYKFNSSGKYWLNCQTKFHELTNNYVEAFHSVIKTYYFSRRRKYRVDRIIYILVERVISHQRGQHMAYNINPNKRVADKAEKLAKNEANNLPASDIDLMVRISPNNIEVKSFTSSCFYKIEKNSLNIHYCSCPSFQGSIDWCKHLFLYLRVRRKNGNNIALVQEEEEEEEENMDINVPLNYNGKNDTVIGDDEYLIERMDSLDVESGEFEEEDGTIMDDYSQPEIPPMSPPPTSVPTYDTQENINIETLNPANREENEENEYTVDDPDTVSLFQLPESQISYTDTQIAVSLIQQPPNLTNQDENRTNEVSNEEFDRLFKKCGKGISNHSKKRPSLEKKYDNAIKTLKRIKADIGKQKKKDDDILQRWTEIQEIYTRVINTELSEEERQDKLEEMKQFYYSLLPNNNRRQLRY